jgi:hypothetical protein
MLNINGKKYAKNEKEFTESLFNSGGTCEGYYKETKRKNYNFIKLYGQNRKVFAYIKGGIEGYILGTATESGYMFGLCEKDRKKLGVGEGYGEQIDFAESIINQLMEA